VMVLVDDFPRSMGQKAPDPLRNQLAGSSGPGNEAARRRKRGFHSRFLFELPFGQEVLRRLGHMGIDPLQRRETSVYVDTLSRNRRRVSM